MKKCRNDSKIILHFGKFWTSKLITDPHTQIHVENTVRSIKNKHYPKADTEWVKVECIK